MKLLRRLIDKVRWAIRRFIGLPPIDVDILPDLKNDPALKAIFDNMPKPIYNTEQRLTKSPFGDLSYEEGLKHDDVITRTTTADHIIGAYTTGASISDILVMKAVYVLLEGLNITANDAAQYKLLVDEARCAFRDQKEKQLEFVFSKQDKFLAKLADKTKYRHHVPKHYHKRRK